MSKRVGTIAMSPSPKDHYDPIRLILSGDKRQTLRKRAVRGEREVTVKGKRLDPPLVLRFTYSEKMTPAEFLTDEFAKRDGLPDWESLEALLIGFYGAVPEQMVCSHFEVVTTEAEGEPLDVLGILDKRLATPPSDKWAVNDAGRMERTGG